MANATNTKTKRSDDLRSKAGAPTAEGERPARGILENMIVLVVQPEHLRRRARAARARKSANMVSVALRNAAERR